MGRLCAARSVADAMPKGPYLVLWPPVLRPVGLIKSDGAYDHVAAAVGAKAHVSAGRTDKISAWMRGSDSHSGPAPEALGENGGRQSDDHESTGHTGSDRCFTYVPGPVHRDRRGCADAVEPWCRTPQFSQLCSWPGTTSA